MDLPQLSYGEDSGHRSAGLALVGGAGLAAGARRRVSFGAMACSPACFCSQGSGGCDCPALAGLVPTGQQGSGGSCAIGLMALP
jgi:hypothetical protein